MEVALEQRPTSQLPEPIKNGLARVDQLKQGEEVSIPIHEIGKDRVQTLYLETKRKHPNVDFKYFDKDPDVKITNAEVFQQFEGDGIKKGPDEYLDAIVDQSLKTNLSIILAVATNNVDLNENERRQISSTVGGITNDYLRDTYFPNATDEDWNNAEKLIVACVDAGDEFSNNSAFQRARSLVTREAMVRSNTFSVNISPELLDVILEDFNPDLASNKDKLRAFDEAITSQTWFSENEQELKDLKELSPEGADIAIKVLRKNATLLTDEEKKAPAEYFVNLVAAAKKGDSKAQEQLDIFRLIGDQYETDEVYSRFTQYNDPSVYGLAKIWASSWAKPVYKAYGFFSCLARMSRGSPLTIRGREIDTSDMRNDSNSIEHAQAIIKILKTPQKNLEKKITQEQAARLHMCPSCYGGRSGFETQKKIQGALDVSVENEAEEVAPSFDEKRVDFAVEVMQKLRKDGYLKMKMEG